MDRVLYAKYNSMRRPEYRLTTEIHEDETGKWVEKRAGDPVARPHMERIAANRDLAVRAYREITVLDVKREKGCLVFPFVSGTTLSNRIDTEPFDKNCFIKQINSLFDRVLAVRDECRSSFKATEEFVSIFGDRYMEGVPAVCPANIDSLFSNFIETEDELICLDYEWVYGFPVPVDYIRYRVLFHLYNEWSSSVLDGITREAFMEWFGLNRSEQAMYWNMESCFQQEIHGKEWAYHYLEKYRKRAFPVRDPRREIVRQEELIHNKDVHIANLEQQINEMKESFSWRITGPARAVPAAIRKVARKSNGVYLFLRCTKAAVKSGPGQALALRKQYKDEIERAGLPKNWPTAEEAKEQQQTVFRQPVRFSILVHLHNPPKAHLNAMIGSVRDQTYGDWELCLADTSDRGHGYVRKICMRMAGQDPRIRYLKPDQDARRSGGADIFSDIAAGDYLAFLGQGDVLHPSALFENMKAICEEGADLIYTDEDTFHEIPADAFRPHYKPDYAPDTLRSYNYIGRLTIFKATLGDEAGRGFSSGMNGSREYDLILRLTEKARHIVHIPKVLYYRRELGQQAASGTAAGPDTAETSGSALAGHLDRLGLEGEVLDSKIPSTYKIQYTIKGEPLISIVIPTMDHAADLRKCVESIRTKSTWKNLEIIIVENNSREEETFRYYEELKKDGRIRIVTWEKGFNFSGICNFGAAHAKGDYILLLNNDIEIITPDWLEQMLMFAQREDVGAVGSMLYYPDDTVQHAGVILGIGGVGGHSHKHFRRGEYGYAGRLTIAQNLTAVTAACIMIPRHVWEEMEGLDEEFVVAFNDVDLCMRIRRAGYLIVWTPYAEMYHYESKSRGQDDSSEKQERFDGEVNRFLKRWDRELKAGDPYYNPNLTLRSEDVSFAESKTD